MTPKLTEVFLIREIEFEDRSEEMSWTSEHREAMKTLTVVWPKAQRAMREIYGDDDLIPNKYRSGIRTQLTMDQLVPVKPYEEVNWAIPFYVTEPWSQEDVDKFEKDKAAGHYEPHEKLKPHQEKFLVAVGTAEQAKEGHWRNGENERVISAPDGKRVLVVML